MWVDAIKRNPGQEMMPGVDEHQAETPPAKKQICTLYAYREPSGLIQLGTAAGNPTSAWVSACKHNRSRMHKVLQSNDLYVVNQLLEDGGRVVKLECRVTEELEGLSSE